MTCLICSKFLIRYDLSFASMLSNNVELSFTLKSFGGDPQNLFCFVKGILKSFRKVFHMVFAYYLKMNILLLLFNILAKEGCFV